jgi:hypothetical protein
MSVCVSGPISVSPNRTRVSPHPSPLPVGEGDTSSGSWNMQRARILRALQNNSPLPKGEAGVRGNTSALMQGALELEMIFFGNCSGFSAAHWIRQSLNRLPSLTAPQRHRARLGTRTRI